MQDCQVVSSYFSFLMLINLLFKIKIKGNGFFTPIINEPGHNISNKIECARSEDLYLPVHPHNTIRVFKRQYLDRQESKASSGGQRKL